MRILLCAVNSKFIHASLSIRSLYAYAYEYKDNLALMEFTINSQMDYVLKEIYEYTPDVLCFSCYIWNIDYIKELCANIRLVLQGTIIVLGGPEVSFAPFDFDEYNCHIICTGEGEETFKALAHEFINGNFPVGVPGTAYKYNGLEGVNPAASPIDLNILPFPYEYTLPENKIIYYESSRGCPFCCSYCLSAVEDSVRYRDLEKVYKDIDFFLVSKVKQVKFVDRTFNCQKARAFEIWKYIIENDNAITNFHFEIAADLLNPSQINVLSKARPGLIQFEAGVQSTNPCTIEAILRQTDLDKLFENVSIIKSLGNIHIHLDLIAGLPGEDYLSFKNSFNEVFNLRPDMLQLGFLKLLKGSPLREDIQSNIVYRKKAPYEVLYTEQISYSQILKLKGIESILEIYYNSGMFRESVEYAVELFATPFDFFEAFSRYWDENNYNSISHTKQKLFEFLYDFISAKDNASEKVISNLLKYDMFINENVKSLPSWVERTDYSNIKASINAFFSNKNNMAKYYPAFKGRTPSELRRICHIEKFTLDIVFWQNQKTISYTEKYYLFVYSSRSKTAAYEIMLEAFNSVQ